MVQMMMTCESKRQGRLLRNSTLTRYGRLPLSTFIQNVDGTIEENFVTRYGPLKRKICCSTLAPPIVLLTDFLSYL